MRRWLLTLLDAVPVQHRGQATVLEGEVLPELAHHAQAHSALLVGRSDRRGWWPFRAHIANQLTRLSPTPVLVLAGRRPRPNVVVHMPMTSRSGGIQTVGWVSRHLPRSRVVAVHGEGLVANVKRDDADLVVVPASRTLGIRQLLQGSLAKTVLRGSVGSVLVVPAP